MKAVIMAGGEGTRLRPLSLGRPKPMTPLFDRPVMEHIITLLKHHGFTDICATLQYMPQSVKDYFGDGGAHGVRLTYFVEDSPLGTAGSVKNCMSWLGDEDFLVISGDAVCDLDLSAAVRFHQEKKAAATLVLYRHATPLEYGLVLTAADGRVERFIEKPAWSQVFASTVNTGIYLLSARAMEQVPAKEAYDFGRDLFPRLLGEGAPLYGHVAEGYWCDMGDPAAYLDCVADALTGKVSLDLGIPKVSPGVWSASPLPDGVSVVPPCWVGRDVAVAPGSLIGPCAAIGQGSTVGGKSLVQRSALHTAHVGEGAILYGAILCRDAVVEDGGVLNDGCVLGEGAVCEQNAAVMESIKVWPGRHVPAGSRLTFSLTSSGGWTPLRFADGAVIRGTLNDEISPEALLVLGGLLGAEGRVGMGFSGGPGVKMLLRAASSGIAAAGGSVIMHDGGTRGAAGWFAARHALPVSVFFEQREDTVFLHCMGPNGLALDRARQRKLEGAFLRGEVNRVSAGQVGSVESINGIPLSFAQDAAHRARVRRLPLVPVKVAVTGNGPSDRILSAALESMGCFVHQGAAPAGVPSFSANYGGLRLLARDEDGAQVPVEQLLTVLCQLELERGGGRVAVPPEAPSAIESLVGGKQGAVLRLGRDGREAEELYASLPWLRDAVFGACRLCAHMGFAGQSLKALLAKAPSFVLRRREIPLTGSRGAVMSRLSEGQAADGEGVRMSIGGGWVYVAPLARRAALRVIAEGADAETAAELCDFYAQKIEEIDGSAPAEK